MASFFGKLIGHGQALNIRGAGRGTVGADGGWWMDGWMDGGVVLWKCAPGVVAFPRLLADFGE